MDNRAHLLEELRDEVMACVTGGNRAPLVAELLGAEPGQIPLEVIIEACAKARRIKSEGGGDELYNRIRSTFESAAILGGKAALSGELADSAIGGFLNLYEHRHQVEQPQKNI